MVHVDFRPYISDDENDDSFNDYGDTDSIISHSSEDAFLLAPHEDFVEQMGQHGSEMALLEDQEAVNLIEAYAAYFEDPDWCYYKEDDPSTLFDNTGVVLASMNASEMEKELNRLSPQARVSYLLDLQCAVEYFNALRELHRKDDPLDQQVVRSMTSKILDIMPPSRQLFSYLGWCTLSEDFMKPLTSLSNAVIYADFLRLPQLIAKYKLEEGSQKASEPLAGNTSSSSSPPPPVDTEEGSSATLTTSTLKHDKFTLSPVLLKIAPIGEMNRASLKDWMQKLKVPFDDVRVAYLEKESLGWAAVQVLDDVQRKQALEILSGQVLEGQSLEVIVLDDVDGIDRDPLKKPSKSKTSPGVPTVVPVAGTVQDRKKQEKDERQQMLDCVAEQFKLKGVDKVPLCFIDFELACNHTGGVIPTELGIICCTLREGELCYFHQFIHPGLIPAELEYVASHVSMILTGIPYKNFTLFDEDYANIWQSIQEFIPADALVIAKNKDTEVKALQWLNERVNGTNQDGLHWLKNREGPFKGLGLFEYADLFEVFDSLHDSQKPTDTSQDQAAEDTTSSNGALPASSDPKLKLHRQFQWLHHRCFYHQEVFTEENGSEWHCALCDVRAYLSSVRAAINLYYPTLVQEELPCEEAWYE